MKRPRRHSLSGRLIGLFLLTGLALGLVVKGGFQFAFEDSLRDLARPHVAEYLRYLLERIGDPPDRGRAAELSQRLPLQIHIFGPDGQWSSGGSPPELSTSHLHHHLLAPGLPVKAGRADGDLVLIAERGAYRIVLKPLGFEPTGWAPLAVVLTIVGVLLVLALAYHGIRRLFQPVETIRAGLSRIGGGELEHRIELRRRDELGELALSVNAMADDIRDMLEAKRQLLLAISHELRSPMTRVRVNLALLPPSDTRRLLEQDLAEMETLTGELLESERLSSRHAALNLSAVDPLELARETVTEHFPGRGILVRCEREIGYLALDPIRFKLLLRNLLDNALRHSPEGAPPPDLTLTGDGATWSLSVQDHGGGIPPEHLPHITEPFYRVDPARRRQTGGYGLGLYLCRVIAEAHGGRLTVESEVGKGTRVAVELRVGESDD